MASPTDAGKSVACSRGIEMNSSSTSATAARLKAK